MPEEYAGCPGLTLNGEGEWLETTKKTLDELEETKIGKAFFKDLSAVIKKSGKKCEIKFKKDAGNCCWAWGAGQYIKLLEECSAFGGPKPTDPATYLGDAIDECKKKDKDMKTDEAIASMIYRTIAPTLKKSTAKSPVTSTKPGPNVIKDLLARMEKWTTPKSGAFKDEPAAIRNTVLYVLEDYWEPGSKTSCSITFDPSKTKVGGKERPIKVGLFHEMVHAYYSLQGKQMGRDNPPSEDNPLYEQMCVGLPPHFHDRPYSENKLRAELKVPLRENYEV